MGQIDPKLYLGMRLEYNNTLIIFKTWFNHFQSYHKQLNGFS